MAPAKIQITTGGTPLVPCESSPQLMPFHITYSGPAPIATFFRVKEMKEDLSPSFSASSASTLVSPDATGGENVAAPKSVVGECRPIVNGCVKVGLGKKLVAAFRGRRVVGVEVPLPEGYTGVVLRSDASASTVSRAFSSRNLSDGVEANERTNGRRKASTRGSRRPKPIEINDDDEDDNDMTDPSLTLGANEHEGEVKTLKVTQTFQSIVVWNPDVVVDEGRDEYIRALQEWTAIASEVHRMED